MHKLYFTRAVVLLSLHFSKKKMPLCTTILFTTAAGLVFSHCVFWPAIEPIMGAVHSESSISMKALKGAFPFAFTRMLVCIHVSHTIMHNTMKLMPAPLAFQASILFDWPKWTG